ncbi:hypothetical protein MesoLj113a_63360 [Mesorhizobium sp. 113-1-2]|uniref:LodA/GoxA family CTQ-dependent oxidase n=1 Tax=Mesorhizobium sp. 113-1-2 TaxID=2744515 RepID=UPI000819825F|nr:LodA/GoxA family CTQ-dependent oxidase [Mesorhizobium sp. 113-1-2]BAV51145.1 Uncharacterized protein MLTONO_6243 [Mesorhizobium loti]BCG75178.1 hypothetical protein MesoLj113a_63360 [Mesorhizobium sp. 113-1-2]
MSEEGYIAYASDSLSQGGDFDTGLQPGDLTKLSGLPWQADFNECSTQTIDVTYEEFVYIFVHFGDLTGTTGVALGIILPALIPAAAVVGYLLALRMEKADPARFTRMGENLA